MKKSEGNKKAASVKKTHKVRVEGKYAVCPTCGQLSPDYNTCEGCHNPLPDEPRYYMPEHAKIPRVTTPGQGQVGSRAYDPRSGALLAKITEANITAGRPQKVRVEGKYAVCPTCGQLSSDYNTCEGCHNPLPDEPRYYMPEHAKLPRVTTPSQGAAQAIAHSTASEKAKDSQDNIDIESTIEYITTNIDEILKVRGHANVTCEQLLVVIKLWIGGEYDLFLNIKDWLDADYENRKQHLDSLMSHVRFSLLTPAQLEAVKQIKMYSDGSWKYNIQLGEDYQKRPIHKKMLRPTSVRSKPQPVCFSEEQAPCMYTLEEDGKWREIDVPGIQDFSLGPHAMIVFNNFLIVVADEYHKTTWYVFDPFTFEWSKMQGMKQPRANFTLVHDNRYIYSIGGSVNVRDSDESKVLDTIERYDPGTDTWTVMSISLPKPLAKVSACVCSGPFFSIYVAGGWDRLSKEGDYSSEMNCFNPNVEVAIWHKKAPMLIQNVPYVMQEMTFDGKDKAIITVCDDLMIQYYDLKSDQWSVVNGISTNIAHAGIDWRWHRKGYILPDPTENVLYVLNIVEGRFKKPKEAVWAKWQLRKINQDVSAVSVETFPIESRCWGHRAMPDSLAVVLAMPTPSTRPIETAPPTVGKTSQGKRSKRRR